jgi:Cu/Ag efflux protein CusF
MKRRAVLASLGTVAAALSVPLAAVAQATTAMAEGEVRKIDREQGKVTLRHGPIANLDMPAMTMVFKLADARLLQGIKEGDKVRFAADKVDGVFTVIAIEAK